MASLDPNAYARGVASVPQINLLAGQQQQTANLMNMIKVKQMGQEMQDREELRNAMRGVNFRNPTDPQISAVAAYSPELAAKLTENQARAFKQNVQDIAGAFLPVLSDPSDANIEGARTYLLAKGVDPQAVNANVDGLLGTPLERRPQALVSYIARDEGTRTALQAVMPKLEKRSDGRTEAFFDMNPFSFTFGKSYSPQQLQVSPDAALSAATAAARLKFDQEKLEFERGQPRKPAPIEKSGEDLFVAKVLPDGSTALEPARVIVDDGMAPPPSEVAPGAGAVPATPPATPKTLTLPELKARNAARKVLDVFEYNPETGTSRLEELIAQTSSGLPQTGETAILSLAGKSTPQSKALTEIEGMMRGMVATVTDNKLGAQVSNTDRDFLMEQYGKFNDTKKPIEDRLAAADAAFRRLSKSAGYPARAAAPAPARPAPAADTGAVRRPGGKTPTPQHIEMLRADPTLRNYFDTTYGAGAAAKILGE